MDTKNTRNYIMVINSKGERKQVKVSDYNKKHKPKNLHGYRYDLEWDLTHGFTEAGKAFEAIESGDIK